MNESEGRFAPQREQAPSSQGIVVGFSESQKRKNPLSRVFEKLNAVTLSLNWCPEEDSNFHDRKVTST